MYNPVNLNGPYSSDSLIMAEGAIIRETTHKEPIHLDRFSCVNNCKVGCYVGIGCFSYVARCDIGNFCSIGSRCSISGFNHPTDWLSTAAFQWGKSPFMLAEAEYCKEPAQKNTHIGHDVWICDNSVILQGVSIGIGAVIGAGSVVTKDVPPYAVVTGNPATLLRFRFSPQKISRLLDLQWWNIKGIEKQTLPWDKMDVVVEQIEAMYEQY
jgi:acetyltransferase-like isoleucine patch superfamily enzyme